MPHTALQQPLKYSEKWKDSFSEKSLKVFLKASIGLAVVFVLFFSSMHVNATTWVILRTRQGDAQHAYDKDRLRVEGANIIFWRRIRFKSPQPSEFGEVSRAIYQERIDCQSQILQTLFVGLYDEDHRPLLERVMPDNMPTTVILPESIGELFQSSVCRFVVAPPPGIASSNNRIPSNNTTHSTAPFVPQRRPVVVDTPSPNSEGVSVVPHTPFVPLISPPGLIIQPIAPPIVPPLLPLTPS